eukprot:819967-Prymnesium_polylepis.2
MSSADSRRAASLEQADRQNRRCPLQSGTCSESDQAVWRRYRPASCRIRELQESQAMRPSSGGMRGARHLEVELACQVTSAKRICSLIHLELLVITHLGVSEECCIGAILGLDDGLADECWQAPNNRRPELCGVHCACSNHNVGGRNEVQVASTELPLARIVILYRAVLHRYDIAVAVRPSHKVVGCHTPVEACNGRQVVSGNGVSKHKIGVSLLGCVRAPREANANISHFRRRQVDGGAIGRDDGRSETNLIRRTY